MLTPDEKAKIIELATIICSELLDMKTPHISFERCEHWLTETTKAMAALGEQVDPIIYVDPAAEFTPEIVLTIARELRHIYQFYVLGWKNRLALHQAPGECGIPEYNLQPEEIDANAFGAICMVEFAGAKPLWLGLPGEMKKGISKRQAQILKEEFGIRI